MEIEQLEQYRAKNSEIKLLEARLQKLKKESEQIVADTVQGSGESYPFTKHTITVKGIDKKKQKIMERLKVKVYLRQLELVEEQEKIEDFISTIPSSTIRQIIELKYLSGRSWNNVANIIYGYPNGDRARKEFTRFFKKF